MRSVSRPGPGPIPVMLELESLLHSPRENHKRYAACIEHRLYTLYVIVFSCHGSPPMPSDLCPTVDLVSEIQLLSASPDGQALVVVTGEAIDPFRSVSAVTGRKIAAYNKGHSGRVTCIHVMGDSQHVISGSEDLTVIVWNLWTGNLILRIRLHYHPLPSPDVSIHPRHLTLMILNPTGST